MTTIKFAIAVAVVIAVAGGSAWSGYTLGFVQGYDNGFEQGEMKFQALQRSLPPPQTVDLSHVKFDQAFPAPTHERD